MAFALSASAATFIVHVEEGSYAVKKLTLKLYPGGGGAATYIDVDEVTVHGGNTYTFSVHPDDFYGTYKAQIIAQNLLDSDTDIIINPHPWNDNHFYVYLTDGSIPYDPSGEEEDPD